MHEGETEQINLGVDLLFELVLLTPNGSTPNALERKSRRRKGRSNFHKAANTQFHCQNHTKNCLVIESSKSIAL